ncbi:MAG TPA: alpha/beta hydrolase, partial [Actinomycetota bacterium]|nr:alpha/beta hydrolase [Actinomycetota bacterium]
MPATRANPARGLRPLALVLAAAVVTTACGRSQEQDRAANLAASEAVTFTSADGVKLEGRLFGDGPVGVVLSHMLPADQTSWWDFARKLSEGGYMALAFDFRGFCPGGDAGCSEGDKDIGALWQDVVGAIGFLRSEGATQVMLVGASMGGTASLVAAAQDGVEVSVVEDQGLDPARLVPGEQVGPVVVRGHDHHALRERRLRVEALSRLRRAEPVAGARDEQLGRHDPGEQVRVCGEPVDPHRRR